MTIEHSDASLGQEIAVEIARASSKHDAMTAVVRLLKENRPHYTWVGMYVVEPGAHEPELVLGPFIGKPSPHTRIPLGRGICGAAATEKATPSVSTRYRPNHGVPPGNANARNRRTSMVNRIQ